MKRRSTGTLHKYHYKVRIISHTLLLRMRNVSDKSFRENENTHFMFGKIFILNRADFEICKKIL
jgi:hypothetical protein